MDTSAIARYVWIGRKDQYWYSECQEVFEEIFGAERLHLVCQLFAATSINTSLKSNITLFRRALHEIENGLPIGNYLPNIQKQLHQIRSGQELTGRKINSFAQAMSGDRNAVVVDIWLLRAFGEDKKYIRNTGPHAGLARSGGASKRQYDQIESYVRTEAALMGVEPRQLSAMIWSGVRIHTNGDRETHYKVRLKNCFQDLFSIA